MYITSIFINLICGKKERKMANESPRCCCSVNVILTVIYCKISYVSVLVRVIINGDKKDEIQILGLTWHKNSIGW